MELKAAAKSLDRRMQAIKTAGRVYGLDRIAVMAALNLSYELQQTQQELQALSKQLEQHNHATEQQTPKLELRVQKALTETAD